MTEPSSSPSSKGADRCFERWCRRGDARALGELFDLVAPDLLHLAIHLVGDAVEAEDLVQATFLTAIERRAELDPARPVWPWLTGVLANKVRQHRRRAARVPDAERLARPEVEDASRPLERRELDGEVARAIDRLEEPYRSVVLLRLRHGMEAADIAHLLARDPGTVRVQLHRGLEKLRAVLPAALASSLVLGFLAPRGLAAVKAAVLQGAAGAGSTLIVGGALMSKKGVGVLVVVLLTALLGVRVLLRRAQDPRDPVPLDVHAAANVPLERAASHSVAPDEVAVPEAQRETVVPASAPVLAERVEGRVVDAEGGEPIPGASVSFYPPHAITAQRLARDWPELYEAQADGRLRARTWGDWPRLVASPAARFRGAPLVSFDRPWPGEEALRETRSGPDGAFELGIEREGVLQVRSAGHATRWRPVREGHPPGTIRLWREQEVHGTVLGPGGEPVGTPIEFVLGAVEGRPWKAPEPVVEGAPIRMEAIPIIEGEEPGGASEGIGLWRVRTDAEGRFAARVGARSVSVSLLTPGWTLTSRQFYALDEVAELQVFVLPAPGFHFFDAQSQAPVERVRLIGTERANQYVCWSGEYLAPGGRLNVPGEPSFLTQFHAALTFEAWSDGYAPAHVSIPFTALQAGEVIEVPMETGAVEHLSGLVTRGRTPLAGAEVVLLGHSLLQWGVDEDLTVDGTTTDDEGRFELAAPAGSYLLRVRADEQPFLERVTFSDQPNGWLERAIQGHEPFFQVVELPLPAPLVVDLDATSAIEVEIVDTLGVPRFQHIVALRDDSGRSLVGHTDEEGRTCFANLPPGRYQLHTPLVTTRGSWADGELRDVDLGPATRERVRIELPANTGPRHVRVAVRDTTSYESWHARYDQEDWQALEPDGTVPMDLATDRFELEIEASDGRHWHLPIPKTAADGDVIELEAGSGRYRGVLRRADRQPWPGVVVAAVPWGDPSAHVRVSCTTNERGEFELASLSSGAVRLRFQTDRDRTLWDESENELVGWSFAPAVPPSPEGTWLELTLPGSRPSLRLSGTVVDAQGQPAAGARVWTEGEDSLPQGSFLEGSREHWTTCDDRGAFALEFPRPERVTLRVSVEKQQGWALTRVLEPLRDHEELRLILP